ncbi:beta/gamma crystallin-related protein [Hydrogenophaga sp.]|uniref:beta/gamma crystallin-related protein n=1 Tax=Hydrogenophaga sp. TaxID=1904254 RepID=UPI0025C5BB5D|nr:beta/gamma crystallin-related protein [Hydrogenophaga sp.]
MKHFFGLLLTSTTLAFSTQVAAQATLYANDNFAGQSLRMTSAVPSLHRHKFNDRASSIVVVGNRWEVCEDDGFRGRCTVLRPGRYDALSDIGLEDGISSARMIAANVRINDDRYAPLPGATQAPVQLTFFERDGFQGRSYSTTGQIPNLRRTGFNERASSAVVTGERWEVCEENRYQGQCMILRPGRYPSLEAMGLNDDISSVRALPRSARVADNRYAPLPVVSQIMFYEREGFAGRTFTTETPLANLQRAGFNDRAASVVVAGERWEVCADARFRGQCVVLRPGRYASLASMGLNDRIVSVREAEGTTRASDERNSPAPMPVYDSRRRDNERLYEADITSSRAVLATSGQRCWVESTQVPAERSGANIPGAVVGALLGGILGHQVGNGTGKDIATVGGAVAGGAIGAQVGRDGKPTSQDVQRCENVPGGAQPAYWDVTYNFRGVEHRIQTASAPGSRITVNEQGEPRQ